jgi:hypothetical protein
LLCKIIKIITYKREVLSVVLCVCEARSFTLRDRVCSGTLEEAANEELHDLYSSSDNAEVVGAGKIIWAGLNGT